MPGICGIARHTPGAMEPLLGAMCQRLAHYPWQQTSRQISADGHMGLGAVVLDHAGPGAGVSTERAVILAFEGELYEASEARAHLVRQGVHVDRDSVAALLLRGIWQEGNTFFEQLNGYFALALWSEERRRLTIVNDRFGLRPIYFTHSEGRLVFASEIGALLEDPSIPRKISPAGLGQFLAFGHFFGDTTLFGAVRVLPPASVLEYDATADRVSVTPYATSPADGLSSLSRDEALEAVSKSFVNAVTRRTSDTSARPFGLSLSGGLDARTILAAVPVHVPLTTVSLGIPGSMDHDSAAVLSALAGRHHHQQMLDEKFLGTFEEHLRQMVRLTDGHYLDQGIVMTTLPAYRELGIRTLLRGHAGELLHMRKAYAFSLDADGERITGDEGLKAWLRQHLTDYMIGGVDGPLLASEPGADVRDVASSTLDAALAPLSSVTPPLQRIWHLFVRERLRRETASSLHMFRNFVEVRVPYLDAELVDLLLVLPPDLKLDATLQSEILRRLKPEFLRVTNANTGAPMNASPWQTRVAGLRMKVFAKLGVQGYQPYERLGLWLATSLKPLVHALLLSDRFLDRRLVLPDAVRKIVTEHESRTRNHTFLVMAMMILEIAHQEVFERDASLVG